MTATPYRAWREQQGIEAVIPARKGRTNLRPHDPERYKARNAVERGFGWLKGWRHVATHYDKHAHRFLGFLYLRRGLDLAEIPHQHGRIRTSVGHLDDNFRSVYSGGGRRFRHGIRQLSNRDAAS